MSPLSKDVESLAAIEKQLILGGAWLAAARVYVQHHCINGSDVKWGSDTPMSLTMRQVEEMALAVAAAAIKADRRGHRG